MSRRVLVLCAVLLASLVELAGCDLFAPKGTVDVVIYDGPDFTQEDVERSWKAEVEEGRVTLQLLQEEDKFEPNTLFITLEDVPNSLPKMVDVWYGPYGGGVGRQIRAGKVKIDTWDLQRRISGVVELPHPRMNERFWVELAPTDSSAHQ